jgi:TrmH family RNA methyltransferase
MGAIFGVPVVPGTANDLPGVKVALVPGAGEALASIEAGPETTLMVGSERDGLPAAIIAGADHVVHIPIRSDSLNAAMATTIALYELTRSMPPK